MKIKHKHEWKENGYVLFCKKCKKFRFKGMKQGQGFGKPKWERYGIKLHWDKPEKVRAK